MSRCAAFALLALSACTYAVQDLQFKTRAPDTIWDRAVEAVERHCFGVRSAEPESNIIFSTWQTWHSAEGAYVSRCMVSIVQEGREADVRVTFTVRKCPLQEVDDTENAAASCQPTEIMPESVANALLEVSKKFDFELHR